VEYSSLRDLHIDDQYSLGGRGERGNDLASILLKVTIPCN